jgi:hypothetical protein
MGRRQDTGADAQAILIVPPFVGATSGPPLGPAMLRGAAAMRGLRVQVLDLAIEEVRSRADVGQLAQSSGFAGDHDKNRDAVRLAEHAFHADVIRTAGARLHRDVRDRHLQLAWLSFDGMTAAAEALADSPWGDRIHARLAHDPAPALVGVSVMFAGQVVAAIAVSRIAKRIWPDVPVVWGGAHVTALAPEIAADPRYAVGIDGFVAGYAESTFTDLVEACVDDHAWPADVFRAGDRRFTRAREDICIVPHFDDLGRYGMPRLTLPAQVSRGCAYGECVFCTYPVIESKHRVAPDLGHADAVFDRAVETGAVVSFKDAFLTVDLLQLIARLARGRAPWSACTRVSDALIPILPELAASGCRTLEVGLESNLPETQRLIRKRHAPGVIERVLSAAGRVTVATVVNYMTGLPGEDAASALTAFHHVEALAAAHGGRVEHHEFELERRAPIARTVTALPAWPWASVLEQRR